MKTKFLPLFLIFIVAIGAIVGCKGGPSEEELALSQAQEQFTAVKEGNNQLQQLRTDLAAAEATIAEIEAIEERKRTDEQKAQLEEVSGQLEGLQGSVEEIYEGLQVQLADFLTVALNNFPSAPETAEALQIYAIEAIGVAEDIVAKSGDYKKATDHLMGAKGYYEAIGLEPYQDLTDKIAYFEDWRLVTEERFGQLKKGMTKDEVKAAIGVPYYGNIQEDTKKGVESWLYKKDGGGAAAVYFKTKTAKVYDWNFDAVKIKVVTD
ncbi:MAG: hypothetical protein K8R59_14370 [Thermoanaerobaculales bacterium]|nr:hypothetical protein [Thermoanaerobaculales bacterium]